MIPAVIVAGGRLSGDFAARAGTDIKALIRVGGKPLIRRVLDDLSESGEVSETVVVGPAGDGLREGVGGRASIIPEGGGGVENVRRGLAAVRDSAGEGWVLVGASDLPFLSPGAVRDLIRRASETPSADLVFPLVGRAEFEKVFPGCPGVWTRLADGELTGGSLILMRPSAVERNAALFERVFAARKSQWGMARLLGLGTALAFAAGRLSVARAEARASQITGCVCRALPGSDPRLAFDIDDLADYEFAEAYRGA